jgi:hypothetical protein
LNIFWKCILKSLIRFLCLLVVHLWFDINISRDERARLLLRKQRRATMSRGNLRSVSRDAHLTRTLRSNLAVEGCWRAFLPALASAAELMGKRYHSLFSLAYECWCATVSNFIDIVAIIGCPNLVCFQLLDNNLHIAGTFLRVKSLSST